MAPIQLRIHRAFSDHLVLGMSTLAGYGSCSEWIIYEHNDSERTHCHVYFFNYGLSEQSFRNHFANAYGDVAKTDFSIKTTAGRGKGPITLEGAIKYASRDGELKCKFARGIEIKAIYQNEEQLKAIKDAIPAKVVEPRQMTKWKLVEICFEEMKQEEKVYGHKLTKGQVVDLVVDVLLVYKQVFSTYKVIEIIETMAARDGQYEMAKEFIINSLKY